MKRFFLICVVWCTLAGCTRSEVQGEGDSYVTVSTVADPSLNIKQAKASGYTIPLPADYSYTVRHTGDKTVVAEGGSTDALGTLALMAGNYLFEVASVGEASLDRPSYAGSAPFSVKKGATTAVEVKAKLASSVVAVRFSDAVKSGFKSYKATISAQEHSQTAVFDASTPEGTLVYLPAPATKVTCTIDVVSAQGIAFQTKQTVDGLAAADLLAWTVDIPAYTEKPTDPLVLELVLDQTLNEDQKNFTLSLNPTATGTPTISGRGIPNLSAPIGVKYRVGSEVKIDLATKGGLAKVLLMFRVGQKPIEGQALQGVVDLMALPEAERVAWGVAFSEGGSAGATSSLLDLSAMTQKMPGEAAGTEKFYTTIGLLDNNGAYVTHELIFNVYGVSLTTLDDLYADKIDWFGEHGPINRVNVRLQGRYNVDDVPDGLAFQYRRQSESDWQVVEPIINTTTRDVYADVSLLPDAGQWEYRLSSAEEEGRTIQIPALPTYPLLANLNLDAWSSPDPTGIWGTSNNTFGKNVTQGTGWNGVGSCAQIESKYIVIAFASGGLFSGHMVMNAGSPYKSSLVGVPYVGRPVALRGHYKYSGRTINRMKDEGDVGNDATSGKADQCEIAIKLERWGTGTYEMRWKDGFFGKPEGSSYIDINGQPATARSAKVSGYDGVDPKVAFDADIRSKLSVGYGQLTTTGQDQWAEFTIPITYYQDVLPDRVIITAVSSAWGGYLSGAEGSLLCVDDLELIY